MSAFFDYLRNITYYLLFAALVGLVVPSGKYKKFVSLVMGLILLVLMLQPIRHFVGTEIPVTQWFAGIIQPHYQDDHDQASYAIWRDAHLSAAFEDQLKAQVEGLLNRSNITLHSAEFTYTQDFSRVTSVKVQVSQDESPPARVPFIRIEPVQIGQDEPTEDPLIDEVKNLIAGFYNLAHTHIHVKIIGT